MKKSYYFKNVWIFDGFSFFQGNLVSEAGIVKRLGEGAILPLEEEKKYEVISGDYLLMPGMVNMHTHIPMSLFKGAAEDMLFHDWLQKRIFPLERKFINPETCYLAGMWGMVELLQSGVTAFCDMYFFEESVARACEAIKIRGFLGEALINFQGPSGFGPDELLEKFPSWIKKYQNNDFVKFVLAPHSPYLVNDTYLKKTVEMAEKYDTPLVIHMSETEKEIQDYVNQHGEREFLRFEKLGYLSDRFISVHTVWVNDAEIEAMKRCGVTVVHCPSSNMKLGSGLAPVDVMMKKGVNVTFGTDGSASSNNLNVLEEAELGAKIQKGIRRDPTVMNSLDVVKGITSNANKVLKGHYGVLKEGAAADMVLMDLNGHRLFPHYALDSMLLYSASASDIKMVFVGGEKVVENGRVLTVDVEGLQKEMSKLAKSVKAFLH